jgi:hypothetical protein
MELGCISSLTRLEMPFWVDGRVPFADLALTSDILREVASTPGTVR